MRDESKLNADELGKCGSYEPMRGFEFPSFHAFPNALRDDEISFIEFGIRILASMTTEQRERVLTYLADRFLPNSAKE